MAYDYLFNPFPGSNEAQLVLYNYRPARSFNILAAVLFALLAIAHTYWLAKYRTTTIIQFWFVFTSLWYFIAHVLRTVNHNQPFRSDLFTTQYVINIAATNGFITAIELGLLHGVRVNNPLSAFVRFKALTIRNVFMFLNGITFIWQVVGAALVGVSERRAANGVASNFTTTESNRVVISSLAFQLFHLTLFQAIVTWLLIKSLSRRNNDTYPLNRQTTNTTATSATTAVATPVGIHKVVKLFLFLVFLTIGMLWMRTIYRLVELSQGFYGRAHSSETLYGVFEFAPVWTAAAIWAIKPFGRWILELATDDVIRSNKAGVPATV